MSEVESRQGYSGRRPLRTVLDLVRDGGVSEDHLQQALRQALARGLVTRKELHDHPEKDALKKFARRKTHELPPSLMPPPNNWERPFAVLAQECAVDVDVHRAFGDVADFYGQIDLGVEDS